MLTGIFIIMAFYLLGECCSWLIDGFIPGSVLGMIFLFLALSCHWVRADHVRPVARFLGDNMAFFFLPAGVGIITSLDILSRYWDVVLVVGTVTTLLVLIVVATLQQWQENRKDIRVK
nr:CidA/LrgA family protein [uncultured Sanguibacteroides sp.]